MTEAEAQTIREIENIAFGSGKISALKVKHWLAGQPSVEVLGALAVHIIQNSTRIDPPLSMEEICSTIEEYYKQCFIQNLDNSEYAPNRSIAGLEFVGWFSALWRDAGVPREYLVRLKQMLREVCVEHGVPAAQISGAVLEHLFETPEVAVFFADWREDPQLRSAFDGATDWASSHPPSTPPDE